MKVQTQAGGDKCNRSREILSLRMVEDIPMVNTIRRLKARKICDSVSIVSKSHRQVISPIA